MLGVYEAGGFLIPPLCFSLHLQVSMAAATASAAAEEKSEAQGDATADVSSTNTLLITNISSEHITHN